MILSQSLVKDLEREECCPYKFYERWVNKNPLLDLKSEDLDKGSYFENLVLGSGAIKGQEVKDLPRLASGAKSADQKRIDSQAERCYKILYDKTDKDYLNFRVISTQLNLTKDNRTGTFDIVAHDKADNLWIIDLKLTKDLSSDRTEYGWGNDWSEMDLVQLVHYQDLYFNYFGERPNVGLLVVDYSPKLRIEFGKINVSSIKRMRKEERFNAAELVINQYQTNGWIKDPSLNECQNCPLQCNEKITSVKIVKKTVNY